MYKSSLKFMVKDGKRLFIKNIIINYKYLTDGYRVDNEDSSYINIYGVNDSGSNFIGKIILKTYEGYTAEDEISRVIAGFGMKEYNYIYYIVDSIIDPSNLIMNNIIVNTIEAKDDLKD